MHFGNDSRWWTIEKRECFFKISFLHKLSHKEVRNPSGKIFVYFDPSVWIYQDTGVCHSETIFRFCYFKYTLTTRYQKHLLPWNPRACTYRMTVPVMKCHFLYFTPPADSVTLKWSHPAFFSTISRADWPIYEVAASKSGSFFMAGINFGITIEPLLQYRLCKENGHFRREKCKSSQTHALS